MAKYSSTVQYNIKTTLDATGLSQLMAQLKAADTQLSRMASRKLISTQQVAETQKTISTLQNALAKSYNSALQTFDMSKFKNLTKTLNFGTLYTQLSRLGTVGTTSFNSLLAATSKLEPRLNAISRGTERIITTLGNTVRWGVIASAFQSVMNSIHDTIQYMGDLDKSLTNIM